MFHPDFPVLDGHYQMTHEWSIYLPIPFNRRFEDKKWLVLWRPGITAWITTWDNPHSESQGDRARHFSSVASVAAYDKKCRESDCVTRLSYRLDEQGEEDIVCALYSLVFSDVGHIQMSLYFDNEEDVSVVEEMRDSLEFAPSPED